MFLIVRANVDESVVRFEVVISIRKRESVREYKCDCARGIATLRIGENGEGHCHAVVVQITNSLLESGKILNVIDLVQKRLDGSESDSVNPRVVRARQM